MGCGLANSTPRNTTLRLDEGADFAVTWMPRRPQDPQSDFLWFATLRSSTCLTSRNGARRNNSAVAPARRLQNLPRFGANERQAGPPRTLSTAFQHEAVSQ